MRDAFQRNGFDIVHVVYAVLFVLFRRICSDVAVFLDVFLRIVDRENPSCSLVVLVDDFA
jgi:hypothetical protein